MEHESQRYAYDNDDLPAHCAGSPDDVDGSEDFIVTPDGGREYSKICGRSGLNYTLVLEPNQQRDSGFQIKDIRIAPRPNVCKSVKNCCRVLRPLGFNFTEEQVRAELGKNYKVLCQERFPHIPYCPQNFNHRALLEAGVAASNSEIIGRNHVACLTYLLAADVHSGPGSLARDPLQVKIDMVRAIVRLCPSYTVWFHGTVENELRELNCRSASSSYQFIFDWITGASRREPNISSACNSDTPEGSSEWRQAQAKELMRHLPVTYHARIRNTFGLPSSTDETLQIEVPHIHCLIAMFGADGQPLPYKKVRKILRKLHLARHQTYISPLRPLKSQCAEGVSDKDLAINAFFQANGFIRYAIEPTGNALDDNQLLFRSMFRGASPDQGFLSGVVRGAKLARASKAWKTITPWSTLRKVLDDRLRLANLTGLECVKEGEPEKLKHIERRIMGTPRPMVFNGRTVKRIVYNSYTLVSYSSSSLSKKVGNILSKKSHTVFQTFSETSKWMGPGP